MAAPDDEGSPDLLGEQRLEREARVLEVARELIAELGYDGVTMRHLARESRVSVPTLYKHFGDKSALLVRAVGSQFGELLSRVDHAKAERGVELLLAIPDWAGRAIVRSPRYSRSVISVFVASGQIQEVTETVLGALAEEFERALRRIAEDGELEAWVDTATLAERLATQHVMTCLQWASGDLASRSLAPCLVYGVCMTALGAVRGGARHQLAARAREVQADARAQSPRVRRPARR